MRYWIRFYRDFDDPSSAIGAAVPREAPNAAGAAAAAGAPAIAEAKRAGARWLVVFNAKLAPVHRLEI